MRSFVLSLSVLLACAPTHQQVSDDHVASRAASGRFGAGERVTLFLPQGTAEAPSIQKVEFDVTGAYYLGDADAPVVIAEFADFQCPYCASAHAQLVDVRNELAESGVAQWVFIDFPLPNHDRSIPAASLARCAGDIGGPGDFWRAHDALFERQMGWSNSANIHDAFSSISASIGIPAQVATCASTRAHHGFLAHAFERGMSIGIPGTPAFFVGGLPVGAQLDATSLRALVDEIQRVGVDSILVAGGVQLEDPSR